MTVVYIEDQDIYPYVVGNSFSVEQNRAQFGQVLINSVPSITGIDIDDFWNPLNPASIFYGVSDLTTISVRIENDDTVVFDGFIESVTSNGDQTVTVDLQSSLQRALQTNIIYSTAGQNLDPAQIFIEICELYSINYDPVSALNSSAVYQLNEVLCSSVVGSPTTKVTEYLDQLAMIGVAAIYAVGNVLYFEVFQDETIDYPVYTLLNSSDQSEYFILTNPIIASVQKEIPQGYAVTYYSPGLPTQEATATYGDEQNSFAVEGGEGAIVRIASLQAATWIGLAYLAYLARPDSQVTLNISTVLASELQVGWQMELDMQEGDVPFPFIITGITLLDDVQSTLTGVGTVII
jgi:hypothetical protein